MLSESKSKRISFKGENKLRYINQSLTPGCGRSDNRDNLHRPPQRHWATGEAEKSQGPFRWARLTAP